MPSFIKQTAFVLFLCGASLAGTNFALAQPEVTTVFTSGQDGYHTYRIPAVVATTNGTLLAFCEGRKNSRSDTGNIDLLLKRSTDGGRTWRPQQVVWADDHNVCGNPAPVVDRDTGVIWLLSTWNLGSDGEKAIENGTSQNTRRVFVLCSKDDGLTWSKPREITTDVKKPDWRWYATGPVNGIQLIRGSHKGRLVIPANHSEMGPDGKSISRSQIIYSDDHGATWHLGGVEDKLTNESTVTELSDGSLMQNMRSYRGTHRRAVAVSHDSGASWSPLRWDSTLIEPVCQGSILRCTWPDNGQKSRILFSNPASEKRENLTVRVSYDEGATWPVAKSIHPGPAAYSCLVMLPDKTIGDLYECGEKNSYEKIVLARMSLKWLEDANKELTTMNQTQTRNDEKTLNWKQLPPIPDNFGFASPFAGVSGGALIVAGGANFPHGMPWDGGKKVWHDSLFILPTPDGKWLTDFKLPQPVAYGVSVTTSDGVLCAGGGNANENSRDVFLLQWIDGQLKTKPLPPLPKPMSNGCGALVGNTVYVAGGIETPNATNTMKNFWSLDLASPDSGWRELAPWPGPGRMLAVAGAYHGAFFLFSGTELQPDASGKSVRRYLTDAYCFKPDGGWTKLSDLPRAAVAAPSPAIVLKDRLLVVSGDDGKLVNFEPMSQHPGFPKNVLAFDPAQDKWSQLPNSPLSRATATTAIWDHHAVIVNGEVHPGVRTPQVWELNLR